jgi:hypothetical protein
MRSGALYFAIIFIIIWNVLFLNKQYIPWYDANQYIYLVSLNLLFIILTIANALYRNYLDGKERVMFPDEMKVAMSAVGIYAVIVSVFTFIFYKFIDIELIPSILDSIEASLPINQDILIDRGISEAEYIQENMANARKMISPFSLSTMMLVAVMSTGLIYSLVLVIIRIKLLPLFFRK